MATAPAPVIKRRRDAKKRSVKNNRDGMSGWVKRACITIHLRDRSIESRAAICVKRPRNINIPMVSSILARYHTMNDGKGNRGVVKTSASDCLFFT